MRKFIAMSIFSENLRLLRAEKQLSQQKLAEALFITRAALSKYEEGKSEPPLTTLSRMARFFHVSIDVLIGVDLHKVSIEKLLQLEDNRILLPITVDAQGKDNIEIVPLKAKAGYLQGYSDPEFIENLQQMRLPFLGSGKYRAFPIEGDSMPPHSDGALIIGRYTEQLSDIKDGKTYIILSKNDGIVYKRLFRKGKSNNTFIFYSDNTAYKPYEVNARDILEVWAYTCSVNTKEFNPNAPGAMDIQEMLLRLQAELLELKELVKR